MRIFFRISVWLLSIVAVFVVFANLWVVGSTREQVMEKMPGAGQPTVLLLLGTSHKTMTGDDNLFYQQRITTAFTLYKAGYINRIILSGDHRTKYYNEPLVMRKSLVALGVPDSVLLADDGGVRTLDSIIRCKELFGVDEIIVVTQRFHAYRALFISNYYKIKAIAMVPETATDIPVFGVLLREFFARPLAVLDLYLLHRRPEFKHAVIN